jgi:hypothetical protein
VGRQDLPGDQLPLRRLVLAVSVLEGLDLEPHDAGVLLTGPNVLVPWDELEQTVRGHLGRADDPDDATARLRVSVLLRLLALVADLGPTAPVVLRQAARALALPQDHAVHPGSDWVQEQVLGGVLQCGVALLGVLDDPVQVLPLPPVVAQAAGVDPAEWWPAVREHAEGMGHLAVQRLRRDRGGRQQVMRPIGGVDVPTLLMAPALRGYLADGDGSGMRAVAVPMRSRGWFDLARIDPAFVGAAWSATAEPERGLPVPLLVTAHEVGAAPVGGDVREALSDPVREETWKHDVRYHR